MNHLVLLLAAGALVCQSAASDVHRNLRKLPNSLKLEGHFEDNVIPSKGGLIKFVKIIQKPPLTVHQRGQPIELNCEAMGSPAPTIQWLRNYLPILEHDQQSTELIDSSPSSVAHVNSTLIVRPARQRAQLYACLVTAGRHTALATTTVYNTGKPYKPDFGLNSDLSERHRLYPLRPRIVVSYKVLMDEFGRSVVLPCRVKGHPRPRVGWWDNNGVVVTDSERMKVLRTGELLISRLQWSDMGEFTCRAHNLFGGDSVTTFVYPLAV